MAMQTHRTPDVFATAFDREHWSRRKNEIHARIPVSRVVERVLVLKRSGAEFQGLCPFHNEKTPSFTINDRKGFYHCFGCGAHGDAISFVMAQQRLDFKDAVQLLESENGLEHLKRAMPLPPPVQAPQRDDVAKAEAVQRIAEQAVELEKDGPVDQYLRGRNILPPATYGFGDATINAGWPADLRFHPACWHGKERREFPAMVGMFRTHPGALVAVHRT